MPASRSVVSMQLRELGDFLYTLKAGPAGAACGGRPRAGSDTAVTGEPASAPTPG